MALLPWFQRGGQFSSRRRGCQGRLAVTAADSSSPDGTGTRRPPAAADAPPARIERTCRTVVDGRRAARALADWLRRFELSEPEFQVLWRLRDVSGVGLDQTTLANQLAMSPAQVSATVERLGTRGWIVAHLRPEDRRRRLWQLSASGQAMLAVMLSHADRLRWEAATHATSGANATRREAAA